MKKLSINKLLVIVVFSIMIVVAITIRSQFGVYSQAEDNVILDYETFKAKVSTEQRKEKNKRFNYPGSPNTKKLIREFPEGVGDLPKITHWWVGLSALPVETSDAIVIGKVTNREAYLSDDETDIYTEYEVKIEKVLKDSSESLNSNDVVSFVRKGGSIRFKSGKIQKYNIGRYGVVKQNHRYLMFLKKYNGVDFFIVTGYEFSGNKVTPLDGQENKNPKNTLPFEKYLNADEETLLRDIQLALQDYRNKGGTK